MLNVSPGLVSPVETNHLFSVLYCYYYITSLSLSLSLIVAQDFVRMTYIMSLTDDSLIEILSKLPLKSLTRSKCVSKACNQLISDDLIRGKHPLVLSGVYYRRGSGNSSEPRYGSLINSPGDKPGGRFVDLNQELTQLLSFHKTSHLVDCCNGLLLFASRYCRTTLRVCCPATNRWVSLPEPGKRPLLSVLAFDPSRSPHYKVVSFTGWREKGAELEVFSSETGKWVEREVEWAGIDNDAMSATMRYFDGALHILAHPQSIVRVDLESMTCRRIELPDGPVTWRCCMGVMAGGQVSYASSVAEDNNLIKVWTLDGGGNGWVLKHGITAVNRDFKVLGFDPEREAVYIWVPGKMLAYDLVKERFEDVCELNGDMEGVYVQQVWLFPLSRFMSECLAAGLLLE